MKVAAQMADQAIRNAVSIERIKAGQARQVDKFLRDMGKELRRRLIEEDLTAFNRGRVSKLVGTIDEALHGITERQLTGLRSEWRELAVYQSQFESRSLDAVLINTTTAVPAPQQVISAVFTNPLSARGGNGGQILEEFVESYSTQEIKRITGAIQQGYFEGATTSDIIKRLQGTAAQGYNDGILATSDRNLKTVVRTGTQHVANTARAETLKTNSDIAPRYRWMATLDTRTSQQCRSLDFQEFKWGEGPVPPLHPNCRSTIVAVLSEKYSFLQEDEMRASKGDKGGKQIKSTDYYHWLKTQPNSTVVNALGQTRAKLFLKGGLSAEQFAALNIDRDYMPMTLDQMRKIEPDAFRVAGIDK